MVYTTKEQIIAALRKMIDDHQLTQRDVAELACVSIKSVESWLAPPGAANHRTMHARHLRSIHMALPAFLRRRRSQQKKE